ncbi:MAG: hypothetical protein ABIJ42_05015 [Acidobacteriota bacterium]
MHTHNKPKAISGLSILSFLLTAALIPALTVTGYSQNIYPKKDLIFTQIVAGDGFDSSIAVTNRGTYAYEGSILFTTGTDGAEWNPIVNSTRVTNGSMNVVISPDQTKIFYIKETGLKVGYAVFLSIDWSVDNHLEGNLTYFSYDVSGIQDAVGVPDSKEFYLSSLPYSNFYDVGLSLANPDLYSTGAADIRVLLFNEAGEIVTQCSFVMAPNAHLSRFLSELPWETPINTLDPITIGKVEIESSVAISGIAMTITDGAGGKSEISTLPLDAAPLTYTLTMEADNGDVYEGEMSLWVEGFYVKGYMHITGVNSEYYDDAYSWQPFLVTGRLIGLDMDLSFYCDWWPTTEDTGVSLYIYFSQFFAGSDEMNGYWSADYAWNEGVAPLRGDITINNTMIGE